MFYFSGKANELINSPPSSTGEGDKSGNSSRRPTYVLPSTDAISKPRPVALNKVNGYNNNKLNNVQGKQQLFIGLDDTNGNALDDSFKAKSYPSVKKLNLKVFNNLKSNSSQVSNENSIVADGTDGPSPLTAPVVFPASTPVYPSLPPSHENSPTPDIIKGKNIKRLSTQIEKNSFNDTMADLNVISKHSSAVNNSSHQNGNEHDPDLDANKENQNISIFETSSIDDIQDMSNTSNININATGNFHFFCLMLDKNHKFLVKNSDECEKWLCLYSLVIFQLMYSDVFFLYFQCLSNPSYLCFPFFKLL